VDNMSNVPFLDLKQDYLALKEELDAAYSRVMNSGYFILGPELEAFEGEFAAYCGTKHCIGVANGLDALVLALRALSIGPGDEVLVPANTFIASFLAVTAVGATPLAVPSDPRTYNIDTAQLDQFLTSKTKAIMPVHLYGQPADMDNVVTFARANKLWVIEDSAQAQGAKYRGQICGAIGDIAATSFYPAKNLGAFGDGGAVTTQSDELAQAVRRLRNYGSTSKYHHEVLGVNSRLDELQAAFLRAKLNKLDEWNARRTAVASAYTRALERSEVICPHVPDWAEPVWHLYVVRVNNRQLVQETLSKSGIHTSVHYPVPAHLQPCYGAISAEHLRLVETQSHELLSLPISPFISFEQAGRVASALTQAIRVD
jgi:dTDP-4-amino-4,6-dideoxygalactose transaminase